MLYKMNTQMERHEVLQALRKGAFPPGFEENNLIEVILVLLRVPLLFRFVLWSFDEITQFDFRFSSVLFEK